MYALLIRHGKCAGNAERRYIGSTDADLTPDGRAEAERAKKDPSVRKVFVSPLIRARDTARILFPNAEQIVLPDLRETDFGIFEGRNADEMADDPAYRAWVDGGCTGRCPGGESRAEMQKRAVGAFTKAVFAEAEKSRAASEKADLPDGAPSDGPVFVTHGGVIMALMEALCRPHRDFYDFHAPNLGGFRAECVIESGSLSLRKPEFIDLRR